MQSQIIAATGNRSLKRNQSAALQAKRDLFPTVMQMRQNKEIAEASLAQQKESSDAQLAFQEKQMAQQAAQQRKTQAYQEEQAQKALGMEGIKMGIGLMGSSLFGGDEPSNVASANIGGAEKVPYIPMSDGGTGATAPVGASGTGFGLKSMFKSGAGYLGSAATGGAVGFGASKLLGSGGGLKGSLIGAGAGMLPGLISGLGNYFGSEGSTLMGSIDFGGMLSGGLGGALGGFFG